MKKQDLINYIDEYLDIHSFHDDSKNGLQVDDSKNEIRKLGYAVDANTYIFDKAIKENVDILLVHHGLYWGDEEVLVGVPYERVSRLIKNDIALYAAHLPLDANTNVGNNIGLLNAFIEVFNLHEGEYKIENFGKYDGQNISYGIQLDRGIQINDIVSRFAEKLGLEKVLYNFGNKTLINSVAFCSGRASKWLKEVNNSSYDVFITGELTHEGIINAKELGQTIFLGGHYETEIIGVKQMAEHLKNTFGLEIVFIDEKY